MIHILTDNLGACPWSVSCLHLPRRAPRSAPLRPPSVQLNGAPARTGPPTSPKPLRPYPRWLGPRLLTLPLRAQTAQDAMQKRLPRLFRPTTLPRVTDQTLSIDPWSDLPPYTCMHSLLHKTKRFRLVLLLQERLPGPLLPQKVHPGDPLPHPLGLGGDGHLLRSPRFRGIRAWCWVCSGVCAEYCLRGGNEHARVPSRHCWLRYVRTFSERKSRELHNLYIV